jgi:hypothetical protein
MSPGGGGPPDQGNGPPGPPQPQDATNTSQATQATTEASGHSHAKRAGRQCGAEMLAGLRRRRATARRLPPIGPCGCIRDPDFDRHRCGRETITSMVDGYRDAALHLRALGLLPAPLLPEMRALWRRGPEERRLVAEIASRWELAR